MISDKKNSTRTGRPIAAQYIPNCTCAYNIYTSKKHAIVFISAQLLLLSPSPAVAQSGPNGTGTPPPPPEQYPYARFSPSMAIIIAVLIAALFFMGFFSVYIRHCSETASGGSVRPLGGLGASLRRRATARGLDPTVIETFPTFVYSELKGRKIGKGALECAVCLNEFEDDEKLRLLIPKCDHVFHPECIDAWLASHVTCPVCRANLVPQPGETTTLQHSSSSEYDRALDDDTAQTTQNNDVSIIRVVEEDQEEEQEPLPPPVMDRNQSSIRPPRSRSMRPRQFGKFTRSHSTGHSLFQPGENTERFTLRLPEELRKQVMRRALNRTTSCTAVVLPREGSSRRGYRTGGFGVGLGEGSSREGWSNRRLDRAVKSDRWVFSMTPPFFSRAASVRSPKVIAYDGNSTTSSRGTRTAVKLPSCKCLDPKVDEAETGLVSADSARLRLPV